MGKKRLVRRGEEIRGAGWVHAIPSTSAPTRSAGRCGARVAIRMASSVSKDAPRELLGAGVRLFKDGRNPTLAAMRRGPARPNRNHEQGLEALFGVLERRA